jgi:hypothetical protein
MLQPVAHRKPGPGWFHTRQIIVPWIRQFLEVSLQGWKSQAVGNTKRHPSIRKMARTTYVVTQVRRFSHAAA